MSRVPLLIVPVVAACAVWMATSTGAGERQRLKLSALAPYEALAKRDAAALCAAFTPSVAARLVVGAPSGLSCAAAVRSVFAAAPADTPPPPGRLRSVLTATRLTSHEDHAGAVLRYLDVSIASIELRRIGDAWRIATRARLGLFAACVAGVDGNVGVEAQSLPLPGASIVRRANAGCSSSWAG